MRPAVTCAALALLGPATSAGLDAQAVVRVNRSSLQIPVELTVGARLSVSLRGPVSVVGSGAGFTELELPLAVAANTTWTLGLSVPDAASREVVVAVRDASGAWVGPANGEPVTLVRRGEPTNPTEIRVRIRVAEGSAGSVADRVRLHLDPADSPTAP